MFKPNTIIVLAYIPKENTVYKVDVTTKKIYSNFSDFRIVNSNAYYAIGVVIIGASSRFIADINPDFYLDTTCQQIFLVLAGILIGFLIFILVRMKRYGLHLEKYLQQLPEPKEVHDIEKALDKGYLSAIQTAVVTIITLFGSIYMCNQFLNNGNLISYLWTLAWFSIFSWFSALLKGAKFAFKLAAEMKRN